MELLPTPVVAWLGSGRAQREQGLPILSSGWHAMFCGAGAEHRVFPIAGLLPAWLWVRDTGGSIVLGRSGLP